MYGGCDLALSYGAWGWARGGTTRVKGEKCPGALPIDRDFAEDFTAFKREKPVCEGFLCVLDAEILPRLSTQESAERC